MHRGRKRVFLVCLQIQYPTGITTGYNTFRHNHDKKTRPRDQESYYSKQIVGYIQLSQHIDQCCILSPSPFSPSLFHFLSLSISNFPPSLLPLQKSVMKDRSSGLSSLQYTLVSHVNMTINNAPFHFVSIELHCDPDVTPACVSKQR